MSHFHPTDHQYALATLVTEAADRHYRLHGHYPAMVWVSSRWKAEMLAEVQSHTPVTVAMIGPMVVGGHLCEALGGLEGVSVMTREVG